MENVEKVESMQSMENPCVECEKLDVDKACELCEPGIYLQVGINAPKMKEKGGRITKEVKTVFSEILPILKKPENSMQTVNNISAGTAGLRMTIFKLLVLAAVATVVVSRMKSGAFGSRDVSWIKTILLMIVVVLGDTYLKAGILTGIFRIFRGTATMGNMLFACGNAAVIEGCSILLAAIAFIWMPLVAGIILLIGTMLSFLFCFKGTEYGASVGENRGIYCFVTAQIVYLSAAVAILYILVPLLMNQSLYDLVVSSNLLKLIL